MSDKKSLLLVRDVSDEHAVQGRLYLDGELLCYTLERPWLDNKRGASCIPTGVSQGAVQHSPHFQRDLPELLDVPGRSQILMHVGNTIADSQGCILLGLVRDPELHAIGDSRHAVNKVLGKLHAGDVNGNPIYHNFALEVREA